MILGISRTLHRALLAAGFLLLLGWSTALEAGGLTVSARESGVAGRRIVSIASTGISNLAGLQFDVTWAPGTVALGALRAGPGITGLGAVLEQSLIMGPSSVGFFWFDANLAPRALEPGAVLFEFDLDARSQTTGKVLVAVEGVVASSPEAVIDVSGSTVQVDFGGGPKPPPSVLLSVGTAPAGGWISPAIVPLEARVDGQGNVIRSVQFLVDGQVVGEDATAPYGMTWSNAGAGSRLVVARVLHGVDGVVESVPVRLEIGAPMPTVTLKVGAPPVGGWVAPASIPLEAEVQPAGNPVLAVLFLADGQVVGESATPGNAATWVGAGAGSRTVVARVVFGSGQTLDSPGVLVTVSPGAGSGSPALTLAPSRVIGAGGTRTITVSSTGLSDLAGLQFNIVWPAASMTLGKIRMGPGGVALGATLEQSFIVDPASVGFFWFDPDLIGRAIPPGVVLFEFDVQPKPGVSAEVPVAIEEVVAGSPDAVMQVVGSSVMLDLSGGATLSPGVTLKVGSAPAGGWIAPASVPLEAVVEARGAAIAKVLFLADGQVIGEDASPPYTITWSGVVPGTKSLVARAVHGANQTVDSVPAELVVGKVPALPPLNLRLEPDGRLTFTWSGPARLMSSPSLTQAFAPVPNAASGHQVAPGASEAFYRLSP